MFKKFCMSDLYSTCRFLSNDRSYKNGLFDSSKEIQYSLQIISWTFKCLEELHLDCVGPPPPSACKQPEHLQPPGYGGPACGGPGPENWAQE